MNKRGFASDNNSGVSPSVIAKLAEVNNGHVVGYGDDVYTSEATELIRKYFGENAIPYFVFTGTAANVLSIATAGRPFNSVFTTDTAHIHVDECGAPERFSGCKVISIPTDHGKFSPALLEDHMVGFGFEHHSQPGIISITQSTEMGTVYTTDQIKELADFAHHYGMYLHVDGARLSNAAVSLGKSFKEITSDCEVDIVSFGGTKNGLLAAESVIFFNKDLTTEFKYIRKQGMQLASKMRFIAAQFIAFFEDDLWKKNAQQANTMAKKLYDAVKDVPGVTVTQPVESNGVFAIIPKQIIPKLQEEFFFYTWNEAAGEVRWMASFDTTEEDIVGFAEKLKAFLQA